MNNLGCGCLGLIAIAVLGLYGLLHLPPVATTPDRHAASEPKAQRAAAPPMKASEPKVERAAPVEAEPSEPEVQRAPAPIESRACQAVEKVILDKLRPDVTFQKCHAIPDQYGAYFVIVALADSDTVYYGSATPDPATGEWTVGDDLFHN